MDIKILTDSSAEFTPSELVEKNIIEVALPLTLDGEECNNLSLDQYWNEMLAGKVSKTSQPSRQVWLDEFEKAKQGGYALICILISGNVSGTCQTAFSAKEEVGYNHVYIVDSMNVTAGQKLIVLEALKLAKKGLDPKTIAEKLEKFKKRIRVYACIDSLKFLARGGRISKLAANIGGLLKIKPIIAIDDGFVKVIDRKIGLTLSIKALIQKIVSDKISKEHTPIPLYARDDSNCKRFKEELLKNSNMELTDNTSIGPVIGAHIGPGGFGLAYVKEEE